MNAAGMGITVSRNENKRIEFKNPPMAGYISKLIEPIYTYAL